jgi:choline dehydrogenase-like flavoprotein
VVLDFSASHIGWSTAVGIQVSRRLVIVGSGASAVHFALSALEKGDEVVMLDVGRERPLPVRPEASLADLKQELEDPVEYFLGRNFESVLFPGSKTEYYGFPPSKTYVFAGVSQFRWHADGFKPLSSFARGGLAEAWTGGSYPFNDSELEGFPFRYADLAPFYDLVARRIGISGEADDLARFMPIHEGLMPPLDLDEHSTILLERYGHVRAKLNAKRCFIGRSRVAVLSRERDGRSPCDYLGRCLWGCPSRSLYTPSITLEKCRCFPRFHHHTGVYVRHFTVDRQRRVRTVVMESLSGGTTEEVPADVLVLGAGTLSSCRIFLESIYRSTGELVTLTGLMDNPQVLMPFVNLAMLRRRFDPDTYQYHQLGLGLEGETSREYIHGQITTLKTALIHPLVQRLPFDMKTSLAIFKNLHAALGLVNINLHDTRRPSNQVTLEQPVGDGPGRLLMRYEVGPPERARVRMAMKRVRRALWDLGCLVPPGMSHVRPMGASVHYAGLLPMSDRSQSLTTSASCESHDFPNCYFVDGTTFPFLPAKNVTFTLMANAARVASLL